MNSRMLPRFTSLLGKLIVKYNVMQDLMDFDEAERDLLRLAKTEYDFYHPTPSENVVEKPSTSKTGSRPTIGLKTPR
jgi:hypothetical protein